MAARFVIGRSGSGKTHRCFRAIVEALKADPLGPPIYWILPRQATFVAERELTCALGGFCRARVLSFDELGSDLLKECGGSAVPRITQLGRQMILGHLLRSHESELKFFSKVARHPGMAGKLESTFAEFERCGRDPAALQTLLGDLEDSAQTDPEADSLRAKLHDVCLIYKAYTDYLGQERLDPRRWMERVLQCISDSRRFCSATVYVDGFAEFTEFERRVLARLGKVCSGMEIALLMDSASPILHNPDAIPHELGLFHSLEDTYRRLEKAFQDEHVAIDPLIVLDSIHRFDNPALAQIERSMFPLSALSSEIEPDGIELVEAPDRRAEVEHAARRIRQFLASGLRMRDIAVLTRKLDIYGDLITAVFREYEIRYFVDRRRTMAHHPLLQFLRAVLGIARQNWSHDSAMALIKSGLAALSEEQADRLENYVLEHHLRGPVWMREEPWNWRRELTRGNADEPSAPETDESIEIDALRRKVRDGMSPLLAKFPDEKTAQPLKSIVIDLFALFDRFDIPRTIATWIESAHAENQHEQAGEHERAWAELVELFDQMVDLLGGESVTLADFQEILEAGLETFDLALAPPTVDEVLVGQIDRTRTPEVKAVLLLGLNEGVFPCAASDRSILSDQERMQLSQRQFELEAGSERRLLDENLLGYIACTRPSKYLYVSRSLSDDAGRPMEPSPFWHRLRSMFPSLAPLTLPRDERTDASLISTPRQLLTALMRWVRTGPAAETGSPWPALYHWLAQYPTCDDAIDRLRFRAWRAMAYDNSASLSTAISSRLFPSPLRAGVWQIETFASCPFKHFLRFGLNLQPRDEDDIVSIDLDNAFHQILENIVRQLLSRRADWQSLSPQQSRELVESYARRAAQTLRGEMMLSNARNRYLLTRIERALELVIQSQQAIAARGQLKTAFGRIEFGSDADGSLPPLVVTTEGGRELFLSGRIDRVDLLEKEAAFAVLDYRLGGGSLSLSNVYHGLSLQLLTQLLVLREHGDKLAGKTLSPAAAFYVRLLRQLDKVNHPSDAIGPDDPRFALGGKRRGIFDGKYLRQLDGSEQPQESLAVYVKKDGSFGNKRNTDVAEGSELPAMLDFVRNQIALMGEQILDGNIDIRPYRMNTATPCPSCAYRSVCRFDPAINRYRHIAPKSREQVLAEVVKEAGDE